MTKIAVDKDLIEQAIEALEMGLRFRTTGVGRPPEQYNPPAIDALRAALAKPAVEPCKECNGTGEVETGIGMMVCQECPGNGYTSPPPPAEVPLLTPGEVALMWVSESFDTMSYESCYTRGVKRGEQVVRRNAGLK